MCNIYKRIFKQRLFFFAVIIINNYCFSQSTDSIYYQLQQVEIKPFSQESKLRLLTSEAVIDKEDLKKQAPYSILSALNTVPGIRMEERSPGSYRLSIRGSLLRSPFGVRNVKIYVGDFSFTDAGGNTYLNSLDISNLNSIRILKGPESSIFGANTGGALLIDPVYKTADSIKLLASLSGGSYGLFNQNILFQKRTNKNLFTINQAFQTSDGYRVNSAMQRHYFQLSNVWSYSEKAQLKFLILFSDLNYQTPGGLTLNQYDADEKSARPATKFSPGASQQKAAIYNKTIFGGLSHDINITSSLRHVISVFGSSTDFKNPFITNYEQRKEYTLGARTYIDITFIKKQKINLKGNIGAEWQQTNSDIKNFGNNLGLKDTLQASDKINAEQAFAFSKLLVDINQKILIESSISYNFFKYRYKNTYPVKNDFYSQKKFNPSFMPRFAISYKILETFSWRASASIGYSSPTISEVRSSNTIINTNLEAETGINYETGIRIRDKNDFLWFDASVFYYKLQNAIVRRTDNIGNEYFINAGGTNQPGLETSLSLWVIKPQKTKLIRALQLKGNATYNKFTFNNYKINTTDYSGNKLTGVPDFTSSESIYVELPYNLSLYTQYYYCSSIVLNDANTEKTNSYHLLQLKTNWKKELKKFNLIFFAGIDNILNQKYSLGNDLNAFGGRYYNAASPINYYGGITIEL